MNTPCTKRPQARGWVGDLDWSLSWQVRPDRLYMAMRGFFDESGTHGAKSPVVIVGNSWRRLNNGTPTSVTSRRYLTNTE